MPMAADDIAEMIKTAIPDAQVEDAELEEVAGGGGAWGRGGMRTKLRAARLAARSATTTIIASGHTPNVLGEIAAAGRAVYDLPMYVNNALRNPLEQPPKPWNKDFASGGPTWDVIDIYKAAAPALDIVSPDIYSPITSSVYKSGASLLVNYAAEGWGQFVRLVGLGSTGKTAFEYRWPSSVSLGCGPAVTCALPGRLVQGAARGARALPRD